MYNSAYRILKDRFEAEDIMQEAFVTAFLKLDTFKAEVTFGAWLKKIVINKSLTQLKKNTKYKMVDIDTVLANTTEQEQEEFDCSSLKVKEVLNVIDSLQENYRLVLTLKLIEGYDYEEISEILNCTNQSSRVIFSRAKSKLKREFALRDNNR